MHDQALNQTCLSPTATDSVMKIIGDFWTLRIVESLRSQELRFCEMERAIPDISPATLTSRLKKLEESQLIIRRVETLDRQSVCYGLSEKGRGIVPVLDAIKTFTEEYAA